MAYCIQRMENLTTAGTETLSTVPLSGSPDWDEKTVRSILIFQSTINRRLGLHRSSTLMSPPEEWYSLTRLFRLRRQNTSESSDNDEDPTSEFSVYLEQVSSDGARGTSLHKLFTSLSRQESSMALESLKRTLLPFADLLIPDDLLELLVLPQPRMLSELPKILFDYLQSRADDDAEDVSIMVNLHIDNVSLAYHACSSGENQVLKFLLEMGADVFFEDHATGSGLAHIAAKCSHSCLLVILDSLKQSCSKEQYKNFVNRVNRSNFDSKKLKQPKHSMISLALAETNFLGLAPYRMSPEPQQRCGSGGVAPLMLACYEENIKSVGVLLTEGADPNIKDPFRGTTALHVAAAKGNIPIMQLLLTFGAKLDYKNDNSKTPLDLARELANEGQEKCIAILETVRLLRESSDSIWGNGKKSETAQSGMFLLGVDGGGTRILIPAFMLHFLENRMSVISNKPDLRISRYFNWLSGTSAGSALILGMVYNQSSPARVLTSVIAERDKLFFGNRIYAEKGLEEFVKGVVGDQAFVDEIEDPKVVVPTVLSDRSPPKCVLVNNYRPNEDQRRWKVWEAVRASAAAPTYFPAFETKYVDGGLMAPNPTLVTMTEALNHDDNQPLAMVLSLGTGNSLSIQVENLDVIYPRLTSLVSDIKQDLLYVHKLFDLLTANLISHGHSVSHAETWCRTMGTSFYRLSPDLTAMHDLDTKEDPPMAQMFFDTYVYCLKNAELLETIALQLLDHGPQHNH